MLSTPAWFEPSPCAWTWAATPFTGRSRPCRSPSPSEPAAASSASSGCRQSGSPRRRGAPPAGPHREPRSGLPHAGATLGNRRRERPPGGMGGGSASPPVSTSAGFFEGGLTSIPSSPVLVLPSSGRSGAGPSGRKSPGRRCISGRRRGRWKEIPPCP